MSSNYLLTPKIDVVFHSLFRIGNESITKALISDIIGCKIQSIHLDTDRHLLLQHPEDKLGILDVKAVLDDGILCNIEIQLVDNHNTESRFLYYWSRLFSSQLVKGKDYSELKKTICIAILDYELDLNSISANFHTKWNIINAQNGHTILTDLFELHIIEMPKALKVKNLDDPIVQWILFLSNPNQMEVLDVMKKNLNIEEAMELLDQISQDKELQRRIELRQKAILDENSAKSSNIKYGIKQGKEQGIKIGKFQGIKEGKKQGIKEGKEQGIKEGKEQGIKEGKEQGIKEGKEQGIKERNLEIAKTLLASNVDISIISISTGLSIEEIQKLKI